MPTKEEFWQFAKEAVLSACDAKTNEDKQCLFDLARTWTQAALEEQASDNPQGGEGQR